MDTTEPESLVRFQGNCRLQPLHLEPSDVTLNMYHLSASAGWLNEKFLRSAELGLVHVGVEVWGSEWSFRYYDDAWDDNILTGVHCYAPKEPGNSNYVFAEALVLGKTPLSPDECYQLIKNLKDEWPASSYHLTRRNCLTFAEHLIRQLQVPGELPKWIRGASEIGADTALVEYGWSWAKSYMTWKHAPSQPLPASPPAAPPDEDDDQGECHPKGELLGLTLIPF